MGRGINSGSIQIRLANAQNETESGCVGQKREINNIFITEARSNGPSAFYVAKAHCPRSAMPMMAEPIA
jgi:hypothetical protein